MNISYDDDSTIAQFKIHEYLGNIFDYAIQKNGEGEIIFSRAGISSLIPQYKNMITPFSYNGQWENPNVRYNPVKVFLEVFPELDDKHGFLFIKAIVEYTNLSRPDSCKDKLSNCLSVLGYSLTESSESRSGYTIFPTSKGAAKRAADIILLERKIKNDFPELYHVYDEALSTFANGEYKSCIDNCRTLYENITQALTGDSSDKAALTLSGETIMDGSGTVLTSKKEIYKYWIDKRKGGNRYRYFTTLYSVMSGLGPHGEDEPSKADAVLILRALEDVLVWILKI